MSAVFPPAAKWVMCYFEPLTLLAGMLAPTLNTAGFVTGQVPASTLSSAQRLDAAYSLRSTEQMLAYQLANTFGLIMLLGLGILNTTTEPRVVHAYVFALWVADIGHIGGTSYVMGLDNVLNVAGWNATTWGNIGITLFLFVARTLYGLGLMGPDRVPAKGAAKAKSK